MTTKAKLGFIILILIITMPFMLACEDGGVQETGNGFVEDVLISQTQFEQDVISILQDNCAESVECAAHQLP